MSFISRQRCFVKIIPMELDTIYYGIYLKNPMNKSDPIDDNSDVLIKTKELDFGFYFCLHNSEKFLKTTKLLFMNQNYQLSIPIATISIEETMKGVEILTKSEHNQTISKDEWEALKNHKHKLTHVLNNALSATNELTDETFKKAKQQAAKIDNQIGDFSIEDTIKILQNQANVFSYFKELREGCFFTDWDKQRRRWISFDELSKQMQEALAFFVYVSAQDALNVFKIGIERYVNRYRKNGQQLIKLPFPTYTEFRTPENWESKNLPSLIQNKVDKIKFQKGLNIMRQFIDKKSFKNLSFDIYNKTLNNYKKVIAKQKDDELFLHPMLNAIMTAASTATQENKDGKNFAFVAGDANLTPDGKPLILFKVIARMNSSICEIVQIIDKNHPEIVFTSDMIEKIIRTEIIIERNQGKEISPDLFIEALSVIGIKCKMIQLEKIQEVINFVKEMSKLGKLNHVPSNIRKQIEMIKGEEEWSDLGGQVRSIITYNYSVTKYPGCNFHITSTDTISKYICRLTILAALEKKFIPTA